MRKGSVVTKTELQDHLLSAALNSTLMTPKHDPANLTSSFKPFRTALAGGLADNLTNFISGGHYNVSFYENTKYSQSPSVWVLEPTDPAFSVVASGVLPNLLCANITLDRLVVVSGQQQGMHMYGEHSSNIASKAAAGTWVFKGVLSG